MDKKELGAINGLKYLLMMCIVSGHYYNSFALTEEALPHFRGYRLLFYNAHLGVEVFFFISGFLMANAMLARKESFGSFIARRLRRLLPVVWISVFIVLGVNAAGRLFLSATEFHLDLWKLCLTLSGTVKWFSNGISAYNAPLWYVSVLLYCEILFFVIRSRKGNQLWIYVLAVILSLGLKMADLEYPFIHESLMRGVCNYFTGVVFLEGIVSNRWNCRRIAFGFSAVSFLVLLTAFLRDSTSFIGNNQLFVTFIVSPALGMSCIYLNPIRKVLSVPVLQYLGKTTYSILATHMILLHILSMAGRAFGTEIDSSSRTVFFLFLLASSAAGILFYEIAEKRIIPAMLPRLSRWLSAGQ